MRILFLPRLSAPHRVHLPVFHSKTLHEHYVDSVKWFDDDLLLTKVGRLVCMHLDPHASSRFSLPIISTAFGSLLRNSKSQMSSFVGNVQNEQASYSMFDWVYPSDEKYVSLVSWKPDVMLLLVDGHRSPGRFHSYLEHYYPSCAVSNRAIRIGVFYSVCWSFRPTVLTHRESKMMVRNISFTHNGQTFVACNENGQIYIWTSVLSSA